MVGAPNPGDVVWRNLEASRRERRVATAFFSLFCYPCAIVLGFAFSFFVAPRVAARCAPTVYIPN